MISYRQADIVTQLNRLDFLDQAEFFVLNFRVSKQTRSYIPDEDVPIDIIYVGSELMDSDWKVLNGHNFERWQKEIDGYFKEKLQGLGFFDGGKSYHGKVRPFTDAMGRINGHRNTSQDLNLNLKITYDIKKMTDLRLL